MNWLPIPDFEEYEVSDTGEVRRGTRVLKRQAHRGYQRVQIWVGGKPKSLRVHRAVCAAFNGPPPDPSFEVEHIDHDKANNAPANLQWVGHAANISRSVCDGIHAHGTRNGSAILNEAAVIEIRSAAKYPRFTFDLAEKFGVSVKTINGIRSGYGWGRT